MPDKNASDDYQRYLNLSDALQQTESMVSLLQWVSAARKFSTDIYLTGQVSPEFVSLMKRHEVRYGPEWNSEEEAGAQQLFSEVRDRLGRLAGEVFPAIVAGDKAPKT